MVVVEWRAKILDTSTSNCIIHILRVSLPTILVLHFNSKKRHYQGMHPVLAALLLSLHLSCYLRRSHRSGLVVPAWHSTSACRV